MRDASQTDDEAAHSREKEKEREAYRSLDSSSPLSFFYSSQEGNLARIKHEDDQGMRCDPSVTYFLSFSFFALVFVKGNCATVDSSLYFASVPAGCCCFNKCDNQYLQISVTMELILTCTTMNSSFSCSNE